MNACGRGKRERAMIKRKGSAIHPANDSFIPHHAIQIRDGTGRAFRGVIKKGPTTSHPPQVHTIHPLKLLMIMVFWAGEECNCSGVGSSIYRDVLFASFGGGGGWIIGGSFDMHNFCGHFKRTKETLIRKSHFGDVLTK